MYIHVWIVPSVLWRCWLGGRKGIRPLKNRVVRCWHGCLSGARCRHACGPEDATATHTLSLASAKSRLGFTFLVPAHQGIPGKSAVKRVCVCNMKQLHRESKKQDTKLLAITSSTIIDFQNFFTSRLGSKFATNSCLNIPPRFKHVATLPCELWMQKMASFSNTYCN